MPWAPGAQRSGRKRRSALPGAGWLYRVAVAKVAALVTKPSFGAGTGPLEKALRQTPGDAHGRGSCPLR